MLYSPFSDHVTSSFNIIAGSSYTLVYTAQYDCLVFADISEKVIGGENIIAGIGIDFTSVRAWHQLGEMMYYLDTDSGGGRSLSSDDTRRGLYVKAGEEIYGAAYNSLSDGIAGTLKIFRID